MQQYKDLLMDILANGESREDRTGVGTLSVFGRQMRFDLSKGFPAVTTKKLAWKACKAELLWFIEGSSDERRLAEITHGVRDSHKTTIWTSNAQAPYWKPKAQFNGDLGNVYGVMWRDWQGVDQLLELIAGIKHDPSSRRHIVVSYNPSELGNVALPPCHAMFQMYVSSDGKLSCHMYQRSADVPLGIPFNIASYALLTHMVAQVCGLGVGELIISLGDAHIYTNQIDGVRAQLLNEPMQLPHLWLNPDITDITKFTMDDIDLVNYKSHNSIKFPMAV